MKLIGRQWTKIHRSRSDKKKRKMNTFQADWVENERNKDVIVWNRSTKSGKEEKKERQAGAKLGGL